MWRNTKQERGIECIRGDREVQRMRGFHWVTLSKDLTSARGDYIGVKGIRAQAKRNSTCKGPEMGTCLVYSRFSKEARGAEIG